LRLRLGLLVLDLLFGEAAFEFVGVEANDLVALLDARPLRYDGDQPNLLDFYLALDSDCLGTFELTLLRDGDVQVAPCHRTEHLSVARLFGPQPRPHAPAKGGDRH